MVLGGARTLRGGAGTHAGPHGPGVRRLLRGNCAAAPTCPCGRCFWANKRFCCASVSESEAGTGTTDGCIGTRLGDGQADGGLVPGAVPACLPSMHGGRDEETKNALSHPADCKRNLMRTRLYMRNLTRENIDISPMRRGQPGLINGHRTSLSTPTIMTS